VVDGETVGGAGRKRMGDVYRLSAEIGYRLGRTHWGSGLDRCSSDT
jgi:RimJ/RimL family protein N-acetyltransferase